MSLINSTKSKELFEKAKRMIPGGVNSPVRAFSSVGLTPPFIRKAAGSRITDVDGNEYIDYVGSWGPMILGHAHPEIVGEIKRAAENGTSYGAPNEKELQLASLICEALPSVEMVRMVNSGTEAVMSAIRLARGYTGRELVLKFEGCYHGHADGLLVKAGSGALTTGVPDSAGVPAAYVKNTITAAYNDCEALAEVFNTYGSRLAAVIVEPVAGNMGVVLPHMEFLKLLRKLTELHGALLIFDEVITGFRVSYGGAQGCFGIAPDITVLGKIIGGGLPVGAYGGRKEIMGLISPSGPVYQAGTLSGNPIAMAAGVKTLEILKGNPSIYDCLENYGKELEAAVASAAYKNRVPVCVNRAGSLMTVFFIENSVTNYADAVKADTCKFAVFFAGMLEAGIYMAPSQYEAVFISVAHNAGDLEHTKRALEFAFSRL